MAPPRTPPPPPLNSRGWILPCLDGSEGSYDLKRARSLDKVKRAAMPGNLFQRRATWNFLTALKREDALNNSANGLYRGAPTKPGPALLYTVCSFISFFILYIVRSERRRKVVKQTPGLDSLSQPRRLCLSRSRGSALETGEACRSPRSQGPSRSHSHIRCLSGSPRKGARKSFCHTESMPQGDGEPQNFLGSWRRSALRHHALHLCGILAKLSTPS